MSDQPSEPRFPVYVDTRRVFESGTGCSGEIALERLPRLKEYLANDEARIDADLDFRIGDYGDREITGQVSATLQLPCQRCLEPVEIAIDDQVQLAMVKNDEQAAKLRPELDPWICDEIKLQLAELVEEQILLALPIVCKHSADECKQKMNYAGSTEEDEPGNPAPKDSPFAVLKTLKESD